MSLKEIKYVPLLKTKCGSCSHLVIEGNLDSHKRYSCFKNKHISAFVTKDWAKKCASHKSGSPVTKQMREDNVKRIPIFFTHQFGVHITPDHRTIIIVAKEGFKLAIDASQTDESKMVITSLRGKISVEVPHTT